VNSASPNNDESRIVALCVIGIAALLLFIAAFTDPIGTDPDTGVFELGANGTRTLLGMIGAFLLFAGIWKLMTKK
jgi:uncharacterized membrane protein HdeD (DUF308 family)